MIKAPRGQREIKRPPALSTSFTWKSGVLDMDSSNSFTLGFPLFLFLPPAGKAAPAFHQKCFLYIHEFDPHPTSQTALFFFLFFFLRGRRGAFFSSSIITQATSFTRSIIGKKGEDWTEGWKK